MARLIHDVTPPAEEHQKYEASKLSTDVMLQELYSRGISIADIFGVYYELEAIADARDDALFGNDEEGQHGAQLTVGDAELAGLAQLPNKPTERQPF